MPKLLLVDDEANLLFSLEAGLARDDLQVLTARTGRRALTLLQQERPDVVILDLRLPDLTGLELFDQVRTFDARLPVILITAFSTTETAIEAMKRGAFEYLLKPVDLHQLRELVGRAIEVRRMQSVPALFEGEDTVSEADQIVGHSAAMQAVYKAIGRIAEQDVTVLILGESGTGKELIARAIYQHSKRATGTFLAINCAALPEGLLESELFGHERGAFTGADRKRIGKFEQAHGGTLFLDEVGDMAPAIQAKVLRLLQEQRFERIGGVETVATDVRVIAATNQDLDALVAAGRFRQDLLYRLNGFTIELPPLRDRPADIPILVDHFIRLANYLLGRHVQAVAPEALALLERHPWRGNVRELQNVVRYGVIQAVGDVLTEDCLPASVRGEAPPAPAVVGSVGDVQALVRDHLARATPDIYRAVLQEVDRIVLGEVLRHVHGNQVQASELLGISRTTLRARLRALGMTADQIPGPDPDTPADP